MTSNTLLLIGLGELERDDVLYWLKDSLARDLAAMRVPKGEGERVETLRYARRRLVMGIGKLSLAIGSCLGAEIVLDGFGEPGAHGDRYYDEDGDPPWDRFRLPDWAAS